MLIQIHENEKLIEIHLGWNRQKWVWPDWSQDSKSAYISRMKRKRKLTFCGTNSGKLKVVSMFCRWALSKINVAF